MRRHTSSISDRAQLEAIRRAVITRCTQLGITQLEAARQMQLNVSTLNRATAGQTIGATAAGKIAAWLGEERESA